MSKLLSGNGRWETKFMSPEHKEALIQRKHTSEAIKRAQVPTKDELEFIRDSVLLPIMLTILEKKKVEMELSGDTLKHLYAAAAETLMKRVHSDLYDVKKALKERRIKVFQEESDGTTIRYRFICRGYEDCFPMMRDLVRAEISLRLGKYVSELFK